MNQTNHYLLTGSTGFLGQIFNTVLTSAGNKVTKFKGDITQPVNLNKELNIDIVVHAAGKAHFLPKTLEEKKIFYDVNFEGTKNLCNALEDMQKKIRSFIFISSVAVYGVDEGIMIAEDHALNGETPYAQSKILAEEWLKSWAAKNTIVLGILRLPLIAGKNPPGNLGDMIRAVKTNKYVSIGNAAAKKSIVWGEDIPSVFPLLSEKGGTFNLTDGLHPSFKLLESAIANQSKKRIRSVPLFVAKTLSFAGDIIGSRFPVNSKKLKKIIATLTFDDSKARTELKWKPSSVPEKLSEVL